MAEWKIEELDRLPRLNNSILIEGLPGIGNVGKIAVDFIVDEIKCKPTHSFFSYSFPHSVFVNDKNMVELPSIILSHKKIGKVNYLFLTGDIQPTDEVSCYEFCDKLLDLMQEMGCTEIITTGGIGLPEQPKRPKVYCTGNEKRIISEYEKTCRLDNKLYGIVGPIIGVSGVLLGLAQKRNIPAIALLAETFGHPLHIGTAGAKEIIKTITKKQRFKLDIKKFEKQISEIDADIIKKTAEMDEVSKQIATKKLKGKRGKEVSYIG